MMGEKWITVAVQCHNFQHRLAWMMASLEQQTDPGVAIDIAYIEGEGNPTVPALANIYDGLRTYITPYPDAKSMQYRGQVRTVQMRRCTTPFIYFSDSDMVFSPDYFFELRTFFNENNYFRSPNFFSGGRLSNPINEANDLINRMKVETEGYTKKIRTAFLNASVLTPIKKSNVGAGYSQIINLDSCPHHNYYVLDQVDRAWYCANGTTKGQKARSDQVFRKRIKKAEGVDHIKLPKWFTQHAIHLNHERDNECGFHLETQR